MKKINCFFVLLFACAYVNAQNPDTWTKKADFMGIPRAGAIAFSINGYGYLGATGIYDSSTIPGYFYPSDMWQYNPQSNVWIQKSPFPGSGRYYTVCFTINSKAYVGLGTSDGIADPLNEMWEYDPANDTWTRKADFPGGGRQGIVGFSIGSKGYVGMGTDTIMEKDFWQYDPVADSWTRKNDFTGGLRTGSFAFSVQDKGYIGLGIEPYNLTLTRRDLWQYDTLVDSWTQKANFPGMATNALFWFSIGAKEYIGTGNDSANNSYTNFWEYNSITDQWLQKDSFGGGKREGAAGFSIGNKGYAGTGIYQYLDSFINDFWEYTPDSINTGIHVIDANDIIISPNPASDKLYISNFPSNATLTITDMTGRIISTHSSSEIKVSELPSGVYILQIQNTDETITKKFVKQ